MYIKGAKKDKAGIGQSKPGSQNMQSRGNYNSTGQRSKDPNGNQKGNDCYNVVLNQKTYFTQMEVYF